MLITESRLGYAASGYYNLMSVTRSLCLNIKVFFCKNSKVMVFIHFFYYRYLTQIFFN